MNAHTATIDVLVYKYLKILKKNLQFSFKKNFNIYHISHKFLLIVKLLFLISIKCNDWHLWPVNKANNISNFKVRNLRVIVCTDTRVFKNSNTTDTSHFQLYFGKDSLLLKLPLKNLLSKTCFPWWNTRFCCINTTIT